MFLSVAVKAQSDESNNRLAIENARLAYHETPEPKLCGEESCPYTSPGEVKKLEALYISKTKQLIVSGTNKNGDVEVWDVNGNVIVEKNSGEDKTIFNLKKLSRGVYYINYSNNKISEGAKLVVR